MDTILADARYALKQLQEAPSFARQKYPGEIGDRIRRAIDALERIEEAASNTPTKCE